MLYIFDWDGTLCDSLAKIVTCLQQAAGDAGEPPLAAHCARQIIGLALPEAMAQLFPHRSRADQSLIADFYRQRFDQYATAAPLFPGARATLRGLKESGHQLAVATGKSRRGLDIGLADHDLNGYFNATRCADETASKPDPLMVLELLAELAIPADQAVMIGDTTFDLAMANAAGVASVAVTYGSHSKEQMQPLRPGRFIDAIDQLLTSA